MRYLRFASVFIALLALLIIAVPALASALPTSYYYNTVNGIEISAGSFDGTLTKGATFTALALKTSLPLSGGSLLASVDYVGKVPDEKTVNGSNDIVGGSWSLKVTLGAVKGTIFGIIVPTGNIQKSSIQWQTYKESTTGKGFAYINLIVAGGTGGFASVTGGNGVFTGWDVHQSGVYILGIQVPVVSNGKLQISLSY